MHKWAQAGGCFRSLLSKRISQIKKSGPLALIGSMKSVHLRSDKSLINTYSMKQPDLYYFETIKMTSQAWSNFVWRIRAAGEYSL